MADESTDRALQMPAQRHGRPTGRSTTEIVGLILSVVWIGGVTLFFVFSRGESGGGQFDVLRFVMTLMAVFLPVAVIWVAASAARSERVMREESARLQATVDAMRQTYLMQQQTGGMTVRLNVEKKLDEIAAAQRKAEVAMATFASIRMPAVSEPPRPAALPAPPGPGREEQTALALGTTGEETYEPPERADFIRALNFPENADDHEGFRALRRALQDRKTAQLIQASQDVLTLLSQDGIYMDDLRPDRTRPELWRRFAKGERGRTISALGGIRDRSSLALSAGRMRSDTIFRDAVHHFLRKFDQMLVEMEPTATDEDLSDLSETRTARAFMLLGRVAGTFD